MAGEAGKMTGPYTVTYPISVTAQLWVSANGSDVGSYVVNISEVVTGVAVLLAIVLGLLSARLMP